ncbi:hypothetical protein [Streptomyces sp. NPDC058683]|uniref:hypothetical protein n=1 Tax=Streptomyces sp. NPDC058683 TaxID=3346597 RepID=UPI003652C04C
MRELREDGKCRARPYLGIRVTGWSGELVSTLFFGIWPAIESLDLCTAAAQVLGENSCQEPWN